MSKAYYNSSASSDTDVAICEEEEKRHLENQNTSLIKENNVLKAQFANAVNVGSRIDDVYKANEKLLSKIRELSTENESLKKKVEISSKSYEDQIEKLKNEIIELRKLQEINDDAAKEEITKHKKKLNHELKNAFIENGQLVIENDRLVTDAKTLQSKIEKLLKTFSFYYKKEILSIDELMNECEEQHKHVLNDVQDVPVKEKIVIKEVPKEVDNTKLKKKCKAFHDKVKEQETVIDDLKNQLSKCQKSLKESETKLSAMNDLQRKVSNYDEDKKLMEEDYQHQIKILENKVELLRNELEKKKKQPTPDPIILASSFAPSPQPQEVYSTKTIKEDKTEENALFDELNQRNILLAKQLKDVSDIRNNLASKLQEAQEEIDRTKLENENIKTQFESLSVVHGKTIEELETYKTALFERNSKNNKREKKLLKAVQAETAVKIDKLQSESDVYKKQSYDLQLEVEKLNQQIIQLAKNNAAVKQENSTFKQSLKKAVEDKEYAERLYNEKPTVTEEDLLPATAWHFTGFDTSLMQAVDSIGRNESLHPSSKIQTAFKAIQKHYSKKLVEERQSYNSLNNDLTQMKSFVNAFIVDASIAACDTAMTFEEFQAGAGSTIIQAIKDTRTNQEKLLRECETLAASLASYKKAFGKEDPHKTAAENHKMMEEQTQKLEKREKCYKKAKTEISNLKSKFDKETTELNNKIEDLNAEISTLRAENDKLNQQLKTTKRQLQDMVNKVRDDDMKIETLTLEFQSKIEDLNKKSAEDKARIEAEMSDEIRRVTDNLTVTADNFEDSQQQINQLKRVIATQKVAISELETDRDYHVRNATTSCEAMTRQNELEKQQLIDKYEQAIADLNEQAKNTQEDVIRLAKELAKSEKNRKAARAQVIDLMNEKNELVEQVKNNKEQFEREKKLILSNANTSQIATESNYSTKLAEARTQMDSEKHDIFAFVCNEFRDNFDPKESIDEKSFRNCVIKTKDEILKLQRTEYAVRKMVNAAPMQSTTDAVAKIIVSH